MTTSSSATPSSTPDTAHPPKGGTEPLPNASTSVSPKPPRVRLWPLWLFMLLLTAAIVGIGLLGYPLLKNDDQRAAQLSATERSAQEWREQLRLEAAVAAERLAQYEERLGAVNQNVGEQQRQIEQLARTQLETQGRSHTDWVLAETEYLLRLANQRLLLERDPVGALTLLDAASLRLSDIEDAGTLVVRKQLATEIMALKAVPAADRTALFMRLEAAIALLGTLDAGTLKPDNAVVDDTPTSADTEQAPVSRWQALWAKIRSALLSAVTIRRLDAPVTPLPSPELARYAIMGAQLRLEQAQIAALRGNDVVFQDSLQQARDWLRRYFDDSLPPMVTLQLALDAMAAQQLNPELPDISVSQRLLAERIAMTRPQGADASAPEAP